MRKIPTEHIPGLSLVSSGGYFNTFSCDSVGIHTTNQTPPDIASTKISLYFSLKWAPLPGSWDFTKVCFFLLLLLNSRIIHYWKITSGNSGLPSWRSKSQKIWMCLGVIFFRWARRVKDNGVDGETCNIEYVWERVVLFVFSWRLGLRLMNMVWKKGLQTLCTAG